MDSLDAGNDVVSCLVTVLEICCDERAILGRDSELHLTRRPEDISGVI